MLGAAARHESEHKAERQRRERHRAAAAGKPHVAGVGAYGYGPDHVTVISAEAAIITECATPVLAGESLRSVCTDLNTRHVVTAAGGPWRTQSLKLTLTAARISGRREYHGDIVAAGAWPAIVTPQESDQLRALLTRPERRSGAAARKYLLSGILRCARCERGMVGRNHDRTPRYVCAKKPWHAALRHHHD